MPAPLQVVADNLTMIYGSAVPNLTWTASGYKLGDTSAILNGAPTLSCSATSSSPVGSYPITVSLSVVSAANYTLGNISGSLTVTPKAQVISFPDLVSPQSYGSTLTLGASVDSGLTVAYRVVSGPATIAGNQLTITGSSGTVVVEASQAGDFNHSAASPVQKSFSAANATLTVQADDRTITLGSSQPTYTWTLLGLKLGDTAAVLSGTPVLSTTAASIPVLGTYTISVSVSGVSATNYTVAGTNGTLIVTDKLLQSIAFPNPGSQAYGNDLVLSASASSHLEVSYLVLSGPASLSGNLLSITGSTGTVVVEARQAGDATFVAATPMQVSFGTGHANLFISADTKGMTSGGSVPALTWQASGFRFTDTISILAGSPSLSSTASSSSPAGNYPITVALSGVSAPNYTVRAVDGTLTISAAGPSGSSIIDGEAGEGGSCGLGSGLGALLVLALVLVMRAGGVRRRD